MLKLFLAQELSKTLSELALACMVLISSKTCLNNTSRRGSWFK